MGLSESISSPGRIRGFLLEGPLFWSQGLTKYQGLFQTRVHIHPIQTPFILNSMPGQSLG